MSWHGALLLGAAAFVLLYVVVPAWIDHQVAALEGNQFRQIAIIWFDRRQHWFERAGIASAIGCVLIAVWNYLRFRRLVREETGFLAFLSRLAARHAD